MPSAFQLHFTVATLYLLIVVIPFLALDFFLTPIDPLTPCFCDHQRHVILVFGGHSHRAGIHCHMHLLHHIPRPHNLDHISYQLRRLLKQSQTCQTQQQHPIEILVFDFLEIFRALKDFRLDHILFWRLLCRDD